MSEVKQFVEFLRTALGDEWRVYSVVVDYEHDAIEVRHKDDHDRRAKIFVKDMAHVMDKTNGLWRYEEKRG